MVMQWEPWPLPWPWHRTGGHLAAKLLISAIVAGLAMRLLIARPPAPSREDAFSAGTSIASEGEIFLKAPKPAVVTDYKVESAREQCNLFTGEWIPDPEGPAYTNQTCRFIEEPQNCMRNGRPDSGYLFWRWKPWGCDVPHFDPEKFLDLMRGKSWALIGDSILRNHVQSLICLLSKVEEPIEVYHDATYKSRRWKFTSHNVTLSLLWSPFLIRADIFENDDGVSKSDPELHLDVLDSNWTSQYSSFDYVIVSTGQWFFKTAIYWENGTVIGCHNCKDEKNLTEVGFSYSFRKALQTVYSFITSSSHRPVVFYRTWTPSHFENGEWWSGGTCNRTRPWRKDELIRNSLDTEMWRIEVDEFNNAVARNGTAHAGRLRLLDTYELSSLRPDGHSGPYRKFHPFDGGTGKKVQNDCLHWCMPGPIDAWNDLLMQMLLSSAG